MSAGPLLPGGEHGSGFGLASGCELGLDFVNQRPNQDPDSRTRLEAPELRELLQLRDLEAQDHLAVQDPAIQKAGLHTHTGIIINSLVIQIELQPFAADLAHKALLPVLVLQTSLRLGILGRLGIGRLVLGLLGRLGIGIRKRTFGLGHGSWLGLGHLHILGRLGILGLRRQRP